MKAVPKPPQMTGRIPAVSLPTYLMEELQPRAKGLGAALTLAGTFWVTLASLGLDVFGPFLGPFGSVCILPP